MFLLPSLNTRIGSVEDIVWLQACFLVCVYEEPLTMPGIRYRYLLVTSKWDLNNRIWLQSTCSYRPINFVILEIFNKWVVYYINN